MHVTYVVLRSIKTIYVIICTVLIYFYSVLKTIKPNSLNSFKFPVIWDVLMSDPHEKKKILQSSHFFTITIQNLKLRITKVEVLSCHMVFIQSLMKIYQLFQTLCRNRCMGMMITHNLPSKTRKTDLLYNIWLH